MEEGMHLVFRNPKTGWHLLMMLVCSTTLICASRAEAFSEDDFNPAVITDRARDPLVYNDFLRITFAPSTVPVSTPSRPTELRAFFGSTRVYEPPLSVEAIADFNGFAADASSDLVAMRCRPRTTAADPRLATWPNLATMLISDLANRQYSCPPPPSPEPANVAYCLAQQYTDTAVQPVVNTLIAALEFGHQLFLLGAFLSDNYGIDADHSGLGFVVRGQAVALNAAEALEQSVVPEYLLRNIALADAHCRCIRVAPYSGRDQDLLPAQLVWDRGELSTDGLCSHYVNRLPRGH
jgi:hypothetical protein